MPKQSRAETISTDLDFDVGVGTVSRDLYRAMCRAIDARVAGYGLTSQTCRYLSIIRMRGGATAKELSDYLSVRSPTTVGALRLLEEKRLVKRTNDPEDGRKGIYILTARGGEIEALIYEACTDVEKRATRRLTAQERRLFRKMAQTIHDSILETLNESNLTAGRNIHAPKGGRRAKRA